MNVFVIVLLVLLAILCGKVMIKSSKESKEEKRKLLEEIDTPFEPKPAKAVGARVVFKNERIEKWGSSTTSSHRMVYEMTFDTDEREVLTFEVGPDIFFRYNELDYATLVTVDGKFFDFGDGEEAGEEDNISNNTNKGVIF